VEDILAIVMVFGTAMLGVIAFSPIGKAIAERLRGKSAQVQSAPEELDDLRAQLQTVQEQVNELAERQDFTERLLAKTRDKGAIGPAKEAT
jgi:peptidoglycan hydrolase CwlO-like protein